MVSLRERVGAKRLDNGDKEMKGRLTMKTAHGHTTMHTCIINTSSSDAAAAGNLSSSDWLPVRGIVV